MEINLEDMMNSTPVSDSGKSTREGSIIDEKVSADIWSDNLTPIVSSGKVHNVYIFSGIGDPIEYCKLIEFLGMVEEDETVYIKLNNGGGNVDSAFAITQAIKECRGIVIASVTGMVASAATIIALACDELLVGDHVQWLSHNYSSGVVGKGHEMKAQAEFMDRELNAAFRIIHKGFFTDEEMTNIIDGKDMWLNKSEIIERWGDMCTYRANGEKEVA